jgi:hypothetical protein
MYTYSEEVEDVRLRKKQRKRERKKERQTDRQTIA